MKEAETTQRLIAIIGLNHQTAPVDVRERISCDEEEIKSYIRLVKNIELVAGVVVLSTCNRTEMCFHLKTGSSKEGFDFIYDQFKKFKKVNDSIRSHLYFYEGLDAVKHLFQVASGLNSMVLGEDQVIGQVKNAFLISDHEHCAGPVLTRLFNRTFGAGKRVRTETHINEGSASISSSAVKIATERHPDIEKTNILLIGAGQTGRLSLISLLERGFDHISITNRTLAKSEKLAKEFSKKAVSFSDIKDHLIHADVVIVATGSKTPLITIKMMEKIMPERSSKRMTLIDISVPRNIEKEVGEIHNLDLFDVDDIEVVISETYEKRKGEIKKAEKIINQMAEEYMEWLSSLNLSPTIRQIQENFLSINEHEIKNYHKIKNGTNPEIMKDYGDHISKKFSRLLIKNLKEVTDNGKNLEHIKILNEIFELKAANGQ